MAPLKSKADNGSRPNRLRFVMLDADISESNFAQLTEAITSALKQPTGPVRPMISRASVPVALPAAAEVGAGVDEADEVLDAEVEGAEEEIAQAKAPRTKAKPALPKYLADLDTAGNGTPFKQYAEENAPTGHIRRHLVAAQWLREHGDSKTIDTHKLYTLYKTAGWPLGITDWDSNFRSAVKRDLMRRVQSGEYAITPLGESLIQKPEE